MRKSMVFFASLALLAAAPVGAKSVKPITPLPAELAGAAQITQIEIKVSDAARKTFDGLEEKATQKKTAAGASTTDDAYATMPFADMFPHVVHDELVRRGLTTGRALKLQVQVEALKTVDAGMAMLVGSADELAGDITLFDAATGEALGEYYIDVFNSRAGLLGLAMRGSGVREKLAAEFAKHIGEILAGNAKKKAAGQ